MCLLVGERDSKFERIAREMQAALLPPSDGPEDTSDSGQQTHSCSLHTIEGCGHAVHIENAQAVVDVLLGVIDKSSGAQGGG